MPVAAHGVLAIEGAMDAVCRQWELGPTEKETGFLVARVLRTGAQVVP